MYGQLCLFGPIIMPYTDRFVNPVRNVSKFTVETVRPSPCNHTWTFIATFGSGSVSRHGISCIIVRALKHCPAFITFRNSSHKYLSITLNFHIAQPAVLRDTARWKLNRKVSLWSISPQFSRIMLDYFSPLLNQYLESPIISPNQALFFVLNIWFGLISHKRPTAAWLPHCTLAASKLVRNVIGEGTASG